MSDMSEEKREQVRDEYGEIEETVTESLQMKDFQAAAHYEFGTHGSYDVEGEMGRIADEFDLGADEEDIKRGSRHRVKAACKERFKEDTGMTFTASSLTVQQNEFGGWSCTIMKDE